MVGDKIRFRFRKDGTLRLLSHHDLMRCVERMLRRAEIPFKSTNGFHPTPRVVFALSLSLGTAGLNEVFELELLRPMDSDEILSRLAAASPSGLTFLSAKVVPMKATAMPRRAVYRLALPEGRAAEVVERAKQVLLGDAVWAERIRPKPRRLNIRPYLRDIRVLTLEDGRNVAEFDVWVTGLGTARADEIARELGLADVLDDGAPLERTELEIHDETPNESLDQPPSEPPETAPLEHVAACADDEKDTDRSGTWGLSPNGPIVE